MATATAITKLPSNVFKFMRESRDELKKVSWPTREVATRYTMIVIVASLGLGLLIGGIDYLLTLTIEKLI